MLLKQYYQHIRYCSVCSIFKYVNTINCLVRPQEVIVLFDRKLALKSVRAHILFYFIFIFAMNNMNINVKHMSYQ